MFGIGGPEVFVILIIALLFVGPDKLPQVAKTVGTGLRDLRRMANLTQAELTSAMNDLAREVERMPEAQTKADLNAKLATLPTPPAADPDSLDKPPPKPSQVPVPVDGETLAVVAKRPPPPEAQRVPGPPAPHYVVKPAEGARARDALTADLDYVAPAPPEPVAVAEPATPEEVPPA